MTEDEPRQAQQKTSKMLLELQLTEIRHSV